MNTHHCVRPRWRSVSALRIVRRAEALRHSFRALCLGAAFAAVAPSVLAQPRPQTAGPTAGDRPAELAGLGIVQQLEAPVPPELTFRSADGRAVRLAEYFGRRPLILALVYFECPMICSEVLNGLVRSLRAVPLEPGRDFDVLAVSFDPRETTATAAAKKAHYVAEYGGSDAGWHFLTGDHTTIRRLTETVGFRYRYDEQTGQFLHPTAAIVLTPDGRVSRYFYGIDFPPRDLRLGLVEASTGEVGSVVDQALLFCYRYDPATGRYSLIVLNLVRAGGVLTLLVLGTFVVVALRRERHGSGPQGPGPRGQGASRPQRPEASGPEP